MSRAHRIWFGAAAGGLWLVGLVLTIVSIVDPAVRWVVPTRGTVMTAAAVLSVVTALGRVIAPTRTAYELGYDAGARDGARAVMASGSTVVDLASRVPNGHSTA